MNSWDHSHTTASASCHSDSPSPWGTEKYFKEEGKETKSWLTLTPCGQLADEDKGCWGKSLLALGSTMVSGMLQPLQPSAVLVWVPGHSLLQSESKGWFLVSSMCIQYQLCVTAYASSTRRFTLNGSIQRPVWVSSLNLIILIADVEVQSLAVTWNVNKG